MVSFNAAALSLPAKGRGTEMICFSTTGGAVRK